MSEPEDDNFEIIGTLLDPLDEDTIPKKKAFSIEDQIATDEQGRRRFHGAFTGGFSAGFFNTVGSLEGWKPSEFKSSRSEKADKHLQKPEDFMDEEDQSAYGIAPKLVKATSDYSSKRQRKRVINDGPIPGDPVLYSILQPAKDTVGVYLLKKMGWKPGQGVGPRLTKSQKLKVRRENEKNQGKIYGCEVPEQFRRQVSSTSESEDDYEVTFAPDDYDAFIYKPKDNTFGMGYTGLDRRNVLGDHISLFEPPKFQIQERNKKKVSISGQAFGVGAFEDEDEDIYSKDDMSKYDFELESFSNKKKSKVQKHEKLLTDIIDGFVTAKNKMEQKKSYPPPEIPKGFTGKHGARISRFEPLPETHKSYNYDRTKTMGRHDLKPSDRSKIINSDNAIITNKPKNPSRNNKIAGITFTASKTESKSQDEEERKRIQEQARKITEGLTRTSSGSFQPFIIDPDKQKRYEIYLTLRKHNQVEKLKDIQLMSMTDWEKEHEKDEFEQAAKLFKPTVGLIFDRFVSGTNSSDDLDPLKAVAKSVYEHGTPEMREAAKRKMFGPLTRVVLPWKPHKLLCRRFNVPEPNISDKVSVTSKTKTKFNIFDYYEAYQQNRTPDGPQTEEKDDDNEKKKQDEIFSNKVIQKNEDEEENKTEASQIVSTINADNKQTETLSVFDPNQNENITTKLVLKNVVDNNLPTCSKFIDNTSNIIPQNEKTDIKFSKKHEDTEILTVPKDAKEKKDLFKAIFLSSDESESEKEENEQDEEEKMTEMKKIVMEASSKPSSQKTDEKQTRPVAKGFFADLDLSKINKTLENKQMTEETQKRFEDEKNTDSETKKLDDYYGPKLPINIQTPKIIFSKKSERSTKNAVREDNEVWIEAKSRKDKKEKSHKKHKKHKDKDKHKKHKSKHKKSKYSDSD